MIRIRKAADRGHFDHGWLKTFHTFSFAGYQDPAYMGFRALRVINEDWVSPGEGFGTHGHRDMEIITYVLEGALEHRDSMGTGSVITLGEVQYMSAGSGVTHSEFNHSHEKQVHLLQIWILPDQRNYKPTYDQHIIQPTENRNRLFLIASGAGESNAIQIRQDAKLYCSVFDAGNTVEFHPEKDRHVWLQVARGSIAVNAITLETGDGAAVSDEILLRINGGPQGAEFLLFDLN
ncbi:pirin family protein [Bdellovibrionota bacterium FG-1]